MATQKIITHKSFKFKTEVGNQINIPEENGCIVRPNIGGIHYFRYYHQSISVADILDEIDIDYSDKKLVKRAYDSTDIETTLAKTMKMNLGGGEGNFIEQICFETNEGMLKDSEYSFYDAIRIDCEQESVKERIDKLKWYSENFNDEENLLSELLEEEPWEIYGDVLVVLYLQIYYEDK